MRTDPSRWKIDLPYFDGRCEALCRDRTHGRFGRGFGDRCTRGASYANADGHAVCVHHRADAAGYDPAAARFRFGRAPMTPRAPAQWDF